MPDPAAPILALRRAVDIIGSQAAMARLLGVAQPSVWRWLDRAKSLPAEHVLKVEAATGISRQALRPDLYPEEADSGTAGLDHSAVPAPAREILP